MASTSDYLENKIVDHYIGKTVYPLPSVHIALCTAAPVDSDTGSTITEAAYTGYARVAIPGADWNAASGGTATNANPITFPAATGGSETVTHFALLDAASNGNMLLHGALNNSLAVSNGITPQISAGSLSVSQD